MVSLSGTHTAPAKTPAAETYMPPAEVHVHPLLGDHTSRQIISDHTAHGLLMHHRIGKRSSQPMHLSEGLSSAITPVQHC